MFCFPNRSEAYDPNAETLYRKLASYNLHSFDLSSFHAKTLTVPRSHCYKHPTRLIDALVGKDPFIDIICSEHAKRASSLRAPDFDRISDDKSQVFFRRKA